MCAWHVYIRVLGAVYAKPSFPFCTGFDFGGGGGGGLFLDIRWDVPLQTWIALADVCRIHRFEIGHEEGSKGANDIRRSSPVH